MTNTINCDYCARFGKLHTSAKQALDVIIELNPKDRAILVELIKQVHNGNAYHSDIAVNEITNRICNKCGEEKEREDDGDRYYWICVNRHCQ